MKRLWLSLSVLLMPLSGLAGLLFYALGLCWRLPSKPATVQSAPGLPGLKLWPLSKAWIWGFVLLSLLTVGVSQAPLEHLLGWLNRYLLPAGLIYSHLRLLKQGVWRVKELVPLMLASGLLLSGVALGNYALGWQVNYQGLCLSGYGQPCLLDLLLLAEDRARSFSMHPNVLGVLLMQLLPLALLNLQALKGLRKLPALLILIVFSLTILFSFSRGAWLGSLWGLGIGSLYLLNASWRQGGILLMLAGTGLSWSLGQMTGIATRLQSLFSATGSAASRVEIWQTGLLMVSQYPWLGVGLLQVEPLYREIAPQGPPAGHLHNIYLQVAVESGLPAAILLFSALALWLGSIGKNPLTQACWLSLTALAWASLVDATLLDLRVSFNLSLLLALLLYSRWQQACLEQVELSDSSQRQAY